MRTTQGSWRRIEGGVLEERSKEVRGELEVSNSKVGKGKGKEEVLI